jgi:hypothetical protein
MRTLAALQPDNIRDLFMRDFSSERIARISTIHRLFCPLLLIDERFSLSRNVNFGNRSRVWSRIKAVDRDINNAPRVLCHPDRASEPTAVDAGVPLDQAQLFADRRRRFANRRFFPAFF